MLFIEMTALIYIYFYNLPNTIHSSLESNFKEEKSVWNGLYWN